MAAVGLGSDGEPLAANPYPNGDIQHAFRMPTDCQLSGKPNQSWKDSHIQFNNGRNNSFAKSGSGPVAMGYWQRADQPFYYSLAMQFPIADRCCTGRTWVGGWCRPRTSSRTRRRASCRRSRWSSPTS